MPVDTRQGYIQEIIARLEPFDPAKVILFGSQARGAATAASDLDLIVVLKSDVLPQTYQEREDLYLQVARLLRDIRRETSVDLIVHTRPIHARFREMDSLFAREVLEKGVVLYESDNP